MIRVQLPARDREALDAEFRRTADRKLRDRVQIVLMADRGRRPAAIAAVSTRALSAAISSRSAVTSPCATASKLCSSGSAFTSYISFSCCPSLIVMSLIVTPPPPRAPARRVASGRSPG